MRKQVNRKQTTQQIARIMHYQGQANAIRAALVVEAASWETGTWSADTETRLAEKRAASNALFGHQNREAWTMQARYEAEQVLLNKLAFVEAILARLVK